MAIGGTWTLTTVIGTDELGKGDASEGESGG